jgi:hypothetical protein
MMRHAVFLPVVVVLVLLTSCGHRPSPEAHAPDLKFRKGLVEVEPIANGRVAAGQTIYVPAYSSVYFADEADKFDLAVTLGIRNTDRGHPIVVTAVGYYDQDGQLIRNYLKKPVRIAPMAAAGYFVKESDRSAGVLASFLVEWVAEEPVSAPVVQAVMVGMASSRGVAFTCPGLVLADRDRPGPGGNASH